MVRRSANQLPAIDLLRMVTANAPIVLFAINREGFFTMSEGKGLAALGLMPGQVVGLSVFEVYRDMPQVLDYVRSALNGIEQTGLTCIGQRMYETIYSPILDADGRPDGLTGVAIDITVQEDASNRLRKTHEALMGVIDSVPQAIFWKDHNSIFLGCNRVYAHSVGLQDPSQIVGMNDYDIAPTREAAEKFRNDDREIMETLQGKRNIIRSGLRKDGRRFWSSTTKVPLLDQHGRVSGVLGVYEDITEKMLSEEHRQEMERRLLHSQKLESLGVLAGSIAHDFNNLLVAVLGNLDLAVQQMSPGSPALPSVEQAIQATLRASDLTLQMLAYSGKGRFVVHRLDLAQVLRENSGLFRASISKTVELQLGFSEKRAVIDGDRGQIQQIVMNLITNASDAIGERPGLIRLESGIAEFSEADLHRSRLEERPPAGRYAYVLVSDDGQGMDEGTQLRLFDPFFTTKFTGRGLGMSAVLGIVQGHQGAILVDSTPGVGTTIRVLFPAVDLPAEADVIEEVVVPGLDPPSPRRCTVLVVDDEHFVRDLFLSYVKQCGHFGIEAADGEEALELFRLRPYEIDCVLLDLTMPRMDGVTTFRALRAIRPDVPVILSSGYAEQDATQRFAGEGLTGFIQKPFRLQEFKAVLASALADIA